MLSHQELAQQNIDIYLQMVDAVAASPLPAADQPTLSLKPSSYTTKPLQHGGDAEGSFAALVAIAERAKQKGVKLTVDMEGRHWTDFTLDVLHELHAAGHTTSAACSRRGCTAPRRTSTGCRRASGSGS